MSELTIQQRVDLIKSIGENGGEIIGLDELQKVLESNEPLFTYDGFEPSGQMHIAQGVIRAINVNKMIDAGFTFRMWVADWFGYLNNKMGGDLNKIKTVGKYFVEIWKASGMNMDGVEFLWTSDFVKEPWYWELVMKIAKATTLKRALRTTEIMGRSENDDLSAAQILYPCMQIADIFGVMKCQVTQLGLDQRKVNVLAREIGEEIGFWKPIIVSHGLLQGLGKPLTDYIDSVEKINLKNDEIHNGIPGYIFQYVFDRFKMRSTVIVKGEDGYTETIELSKDTTTFNYQDEHLQIKITKTKIPSAPKEVSVESDVKNVLEKQGETLAVLQTNLLDSAEIEIEIKKRKVLLTEKTLARKMSKSKPETAIFMTDTVEAVAAKIKKAYCPEGMVDDNPILDYCKQIIFQANFLKRKTPLLENGKFVVDREEKFGGNVEYSTYDELEKAFAAKELFPLDLKNAVVKYLNELLRPVREHFETDSEAKALLALVQSYQVTR